jgi:hypothetical protein
MGLTMNERQAVTKQLALEYKRATKKSKCRILDSLVRLAEYNRSYAARVLRHRQRPRRRNRGGGQGAARRAACEGLITEDGRHAGSPGLAGLRRAGLYAR